ncbi:MAG: hypothetical protein Q8873_00115 [Bacillota bacterium]|nr:hypothetical protein [Bacillota bacterium]
MAKKNIGATLSIKDGGFTVGIRNAITGTKNLKTHTASATSYLKKMSEQGNTTGQALTSLAKKAVGLVAAYAGFNQVKDFLTDCVTGVMELERANTRLETLMMNVKGTTKSQVQEIINYGDALELVTTIEGDATVAGASQLATFQLNANTIKTIMPAFQDLAVAQYGVNVTQEQMIQSGNLIGKVMMGSVGALTKAGVSFTKVQENILKTGTESQKAATLVEVLNANFGGLAKEMAKTPEGRIRQLKNAWGSVKDEIGYAVLPVISKVVTYTATKIPQMRDAVTKAIDAVKTPLMWVKDNVLPPLKTAFQGVWDFGVSAFNNIKTAVENNMPKFSTLKTVLSDVKTFLYDAFENAKPTINWIKDVGLPGAIDVLGTVIQKSTDLYNYIKDNWSQIGPVVDGIVKAIVAYKLALITTNTWTQIVSTTTAIWTGAVNLWKAAKAGALGIEIAYSIWRTKDIIETGILVALYAKDAIAKGVMATATWIQVTATAALTAGQWLLNAAFLASPIGWIVLGIGLIVGAFILLWNKCEPFRNFFLGMWDAFKAKLDEFGGGFKGFVNLIISDVNGLIGKFIGGINGMIDGVNSISGNIGIPAIPHIPVPQIPMLAQGGIIRKAGSVIVGEKGAEMLNLPKGASVSPLPSSTKNESHITINVYADGKSADEIVDEVVPKLKLALANL